MQHYIVFFFNNKISVLRSEYRTTEYFSIKGKFMDLKPIIYVIKTNYKTVIYHNAHTRKVTACIKQENTFTLIYQPLCSTAKRPDHPSTCKYITMHHPRAVPSLTTR